MTVTTETILVIRHVVMVWDRCPHYRPFVSGIPRSPYNSTHKGPVMGNFDLFFGQPGQAAEQTFVPSVNWDDMKLMWYHFSGWIYALRDIPLSKPSRTVLRKGTFIRSFNWDPLAFLSNARVFEKHRDRTTMQRGHIPSNMLARTGILFCISMYIIFHWLILELITFNPSHISLNIIHHSQNIAA